jgi:hypothetical protein
LEKFNEIKVHLVGLFHVESMRRLGYGMDERRFVLDLWQGQASVFYTPCHVAGDYQDVR